MPDYFRQNPKFHKHFQKCLKILGKNRNFLQNYKNAWRCCGKTRNQEKIEKCTSTLGKTRMEGKKNFEKFRVPREMPYVVPWQKAAGKAAGKNGVISNFSTFFLHVNKANIG